MPLSMCVCVCPKLGQNLQAILDYMANFLYKYCHYFNYSYPMGLFRFKYSFWFPGN